MTLQDHHKLVTEQEAKANALSKHAYDVETEEAHLAAADAFTELHRLRVQYYAKADRRKPTTSTT